ncbi:hypothetical protein [Silvimonas amylolytica]|uniref:hypothetical protein n=1 Tax=Silvimonas amylolytica TaxID=449663 RepID=UPI0016694772|nr:hypothetical protein [Silvimonas amylolytica]
MLKPLFTIIQIIIGFYWAGDMARQNQKIDALVNHIEDGYGNFNEKLKDAKIIDSLFSLSRIYGFIAIFSFLLAIVLCKFVGLNQKNLAFLSLIGIGSILGWYSIRWSLNHKKTAREFGGQALLMICGPLLAGALDLLLHTPFTQIFAEVFYRFPLPFSWEVPHLANPIVIGCATSLIFAFFFGVYYLLTWLIAVPLAFVSASIVLLPVILARLIHSVTPRKPFVGLTLLVFTVVTLWSLYL